MRVHVISTSPLVNICGIEFLPPVTNNQNFISLVSLAAFAVKGDYVYMVLLAPNLTA